MHGASFAAEGVQGGGTVDLTRLTRKELQALAKSAGIRANAKSAEIVRALLRLRLEPQPGQETTCSRSPTTRQEQTAADGETPQSSQSGSLRDAAGLKGDGGAVLHDTTNVPEPSSDASQGASSQNSEVRPEPARKATVGGPYLYTAERARARQQAMDKHKIALPTSEEQNVSGSTGGATCRRSRTPEPGRVSAFLPQGREELVQRKEGGWQGFWRQEGERGSGRAQPRAATPPPRASWQQGEEGSHAKHAPRVETAQGTSASIELLPPAAGEAARRGPPTPAARPDSMGAWASPGAATRSRTPPPSSCRDRGGRGRAAAWRSPAVAERRSSTPPPERRRQSSQPAGPPGRAAAAAGSGDGGEMEERVRKEVLSASPGVRWADIAGLAEVKALLQEIVVLPSVRPDIFSGLRAPPRGLLLFGPPGTGKTLLAKAVATETGATFLSLSASALTSKYVGEGEKLVCAMFNVARSCQPAVVFLDEIDSVLCARSSSEHEASRRLKTEFLVQFDGIQAACSAADQERVLLIGATNRPWDLDDAVVRRLSRRVFIPLPDASARLELLKHLMASQQHALQLPHMEQVVRMTDSFSCSDLTALCKDAAMGPVRELPPAELISLPLEQLRSIRLHDFEASLCRIRPSVPPEGVAAFHDWNAKLGGC